ncbi:N-acetylneuraminate synthase family protein [Candidatus Pelagibacter sp.]|nr:N-acetylneuraminate synthase family protein [Candidatus Pelagibacter sp.]
MINKSQKKPFLIAEIGINHNGSLVIAKKLIDLASKYKFDAVKFQKRDLNICIPDDQKNLIRSTPWGNITYLNYKKKIELSYKNFIELKKYCKKKKIDIFCSAWDLNSQKIIKSLNFKYNKVASAMLTNLPLLKVIAKEKKYTFISTGMSDIRDIDRAVKIFKKEKCKFTIMHCVSTYPAAVEDLNLSLIPYFKKRYKCPIGYSGHEDSVSPSVVAYLLGASSIERHITLDRSMWGTDQSASLSEDGIRNLTSVINKIPKMIGNGKKKFIKEEKKMLKKFKYW